MPAALARRLAKLESTPPPPEEPGDGPVTWRWGIPEPLRRYFRELDNELAAAPD